MKDQPDESIRTSLSYGYFMSDDQRAVFERIRTAANLEEEIKVIRHAIGMLSKDYEANNAAIARLLGVLCRVLAVQFAQNTDDADLRQALEQAGELALGRMDKKKEIE